MLGSGQLMKIVQMSKEPQNQYSVA